MKIFGEDNVYEAAKKRIRWLFEEFDDVTVSVSGGKDSTIALFVTLEVARELGRGINMFFLDQEFEWQGTIDMIRKWSKIPGVTTYWLQAPLRMYNSNSALEPYVEIWGESRRDKWVREKEPDSMHESFSAKVRFGETMDEYTRWRSKVVGGKACNISGMRGEESAVRMIGMSAGRTYKDVSWGKKCGKDSYVFHPFYDWTFRDVWIYIQSNGIEYNPVYDKMYQMGVTVPHMRVSNLIHEYAYGIEQLQEIEPRTYEKVAAALPGIGARSKFAQDFIPSSLPEAFVSWREYRDYLLENLVSPEYRKGFIDVWSKQPNDDEAIQRTQCIEVLKSDVTHTMNKNTSNDFRRKDRRKPKY